MGLGALWRDVRKMVAAVNRLFADVVKKGTGASWRRPT
jgi:pyruvate carboxylase